MAGVADDGAADGSCAGWYGPPCGAGAGAGHAGAAGRTRFANGRAGRALGCATVCSRPTKSAENGGMNRANTVKNTPASATTNAIHTMTPARSGDPEPNMPSTPPNNAPICWKRSSIAAET